MTYNVSNCFTLPYMVFKEKFTYILYLGPGLSVQLSLIRKCRVSYYILLRLSCYFYVGQPDITAPGVNILAATSPLGQFMDGGYAMLSGTSMSTPHISGIVALLKVLHPHWSPAAIKSALITTGTSMLITFI